MKILNLTHSILLVLSVYQVAASQQANQFAQRTVKRDGWHKPVFGRDRVPELKSSKAREIEGVPVLTKTFAPTGEQLVHIEGCRQASGEASWLDRKSFVVKDFSTYEVKGKVFAYHVNYYLVSANNGAITERYLAGVAINYVDENGDGKFEIRCNGDGMTLGSLPKWVHTYKRKS